MRLILIFILSLSLSIANAQLVKDTVSVCSKALDEVSYFWKLDSLGTNGFRLYAYRRIFNSILDSIETEKLIDKLGTPNKIIKSTTNTTYIYYYFNPLKVPFYFDVPNSIYTLEFSRNNNEKFINRVTTWLIE